jgi:hypothetical protein
MRSFYGILGGEMIRRSCRQAEGTLAKIHLILPELQLGVDGDYESKNRFNGLLGASNRSQRFSAAESLCSGVNNQELELESIGGGDE